MRGREWQEGAGSEGIGKRRGRRERKNGEKLEGYEGKGRSMKIRDEGRSSMRGREGGRVKGSERG